MLPEVTIKIKCLGWRLLAEDDNSNNQHTTISREIVVTSSKTTKGRDYTQAVRERTQEAAAKANVRVGASVTWGPISANIEEGFEASKLFRDYVSSMTKVSPHDVITVSTAEKQSRKKTSDDNKDIYLEVKSRPVEFIESLQVTYGGNEPDAPAERIREWYNLSDDTNFGMGGKYVWLMPKYTTDTTRAATSFEIRIQGHPDSRYNDLAAGGGGDYRYAVTIHDQRTIAKVTNLILFRDNNRLSSDAICRQVGPSNLWFGANRDINENRGGTYLWLVWKSY
ncbi:hypothetical protein PQX77_021275 [Marasmius sp. AFHP31]|nr:hypothetical protein PQX77_021275 [Marasmius sp. AFHP31]